MVCLLQLKKVLILTGTKNDLKRILFDIQNIIGTPRGKFVRSVNFERVVMYGKIEVRIFEEEQQGRGRSHYGSGLITKLSKRLQPKYGTGFSARNLELMRLFYRTYPKTQTLSAQFNTSKH